MYELFNFVSIYDKSLDEWNCTEELGMGRFGTVYRIEKDIYNDDGIVIGKKISALKIVDYGPEKPDTERINTVLSRIKNQPHAVRIEDHNVVSIGSGDDRVYYLLVKMEPLEPLPKNMSEDEVLRLAYEMAMLLMELHGGRPKLFHCDIKAENIMRASDGTYKLCDFDDAKIVRGSSISLSETGTPGYKSPELIRGEKVDNRSELYSLGITLYTLLNGGKLPFFDGDVNTTIQAELKGKRLPKLEGVHRDFMHIIRRLCSKKISGRYESARELVAALMPVIARHCRRAGYSRKKSASLKHTNDSSAISPSGNVYEATNAGIKSMSSTVVSYRNSPVSDVMDGTLRNDGMRSEKSRAADTGSNDTGVSDIRVAERNLSTAAEEMKKLDFYSLVYIPFHIRRAARLITAVIAVTATLFVTLFLPNYAFVDRKIVAVFSRNIDLSNTGIHDISGLERCRNLEILDLRGNPVSPSDIDALAEALPDCRIIRDVMVGSTVLSSDVKSLSVSDFNDGDEKYLESMIGYFTDLEDMDMSESCLSRRELESLRDAAGESCSVLWTEKFDAKSYAIDTPVLRLSSFDDNTADALKNFTALEWVDLTGCALSDRDIDNYRKSYPEFNIRWDIELLGKTFSSETDTIDLSQCSTDESTQSELDKLRYFRNLRKLDLSYSSLSDYSFLNDYSGLTELSLRLSSVKDLSFLSEFTGLRSLDIGMLHVKDSSFLNKFSELKVLRIDDCSFGDKYERNVASLKELRVLDCSFTGIDLAVTENMPKLTVLRAFDNIYERLNWTYDTRDRNRSYFYQLGDIKTLKVFFGNIDPLGIKKVLGNCDELTAVNVFSYYGLSIPLSQFSENRNLRYISLNQPQDGNYLEQLENLDAIVAAKISQTSTNRFNTVHPDCKIYINDYGRSLRRNAYCSYDLMISLCEYYIPDYLDD